MTDQLFKTKFPHLVLLSFLLIGCSSTSTIPPSDSESNTTALSTETWPPPVPSICKLIDNPDPYHKRAIMVKTTLVQIGTNYWLDDENCPSRHPLFDVEFDPAFRRIVCNDKGHFSRRLCEVVTPEKNNIDLAITAVFTGNFEYSYSNEGFTYNGMRFLFVVSDVTAISDIKNVESFRLK
ncbi:MAG: hypothetical protein WKF92_16625 [Pyrinomonadaceae bacterium]